jgi:ribosome-binding factor A
MTEKRLQRMCSAYEKELSELLLFHTRDPRLADVQVTRVVFAPDLRLAKIYFSVSGGRVREKEVIDGFEHSKGFLKKELATRVRTKFVPDLKFYFDGSQEEREKMDRLFYQIEEQNHVKSEKD